MWRGLLQRWVSVSKPLAFRIKNSVKKPFSFASSDMYVTIVGVCQVHPGCSMNFHSLPGELRVTSHSFFQYLKDFPSSRKINSLTFSDSPNGVPLKQTKNTHDASAGGMDSALCVRCRTIIAGVAWGSRGMTGIHWDFYGDELFSPENWHGNWKSLRKGNYFPKATLFRGCILFCKIVLVSVVRGQELNPQNTWQQKFFQNESCTLSQPKQFGHLGFYDKHWIIRPAGIWRLRRVLQVTNCFTNARMPHLGRQKTCQPGGRTRN